MTLTQDERHVLIAFFAIGQDGATPDRALVARLCGLPAARVGATLRGLERRQLVDAERVRLTFQGLAVAAAVAAPSRRRAALAA